MKPEHKAVLHELYYSLSSPVAYSGHENIYRVAKEKIPEIKRADVTDWLRSQLTYTLHYPVRHNYKTRPVLVYGIDEQWQIDLVDLTKLSRHNNNYRFIMTVIDVLSKYAWLIPLKSKHGKEIRFGLETLFSKTSRRPKVIQTDKGTEFYNRDLENLLKAEGIKLFSTNSQRKASVVERLNRTIKTLMWKYFTKNNTKRYIDILEELAEKYNRSYHRSIKMTPNDVTKDTEIMVWMNLYEKRNLSRKRAKLNVGDHVRLSVEKAPFRKGYVEGWTEEVFVITAKVEGNPTVYKVKDQLGEDIKGTFYVEELQLINEPRTYRIEKVLRKKKQTNGKVLLYVKWKGYPDKFNSYVPEEDLDL